MLVTNMQCMDRWNRTHEALSRAALEWFAERGYDATSTAGIAARAGALARRLTGAARDAHLAAHRRLTHPAEMGTLFQALAVVPEGAPLPAGFAP